METESLKTLPTMQTALENLGNTIVDQYRRALTTGGNNYTGRLSNSARTFVEQEDLNYYLYIALQSYGWMLENGRQPGKFPNVQAIKEWVKNKPVVPRPDKKGKLPSINSLTYLIGRKIANEGIEARPYIQEILNNIDWTPIEQAITADIENKVDVIIEL